jgi:hypothetical protein
VVFEVEDELPGLVVHALADPFEQRQRGGYGVASAVVLVETGRDRVPQGRRAALLSGLLEQAQERVAAKGLAVVTHHGRPLPSAALRGMPRRSHEVVQSIGSSALRV